MNYYTTKGDNGTTRLFNCPQAVRLSKGDSVFEVLGGVDELNSFVGWCRAVAERSSLPGDKRVEFLEVLHTLQEDFFIIQAKLGGGVKDLPQERVTRLEKAIALFAREFSEIRSFVIPGATELSALLDVSRAVARRVERLYVKEMGTKERDSDPTRSYLNRTSSMLYVMARYVNHAHGVSEQAPRYGDCLTRAV